MRFENKNDDFYYLYVCCLPLPFYFSMNLYDFIINTKYFPLLFSYICCDCSRVVGLFLLLSVFLIYIVYA